jgi:hypothetical protein
VAAQSTSAARCATGEGGAGVAAAGAGLRAEPTPACSGVGIVSGARAAAAFGRDCSLEGAWPRTVEGCGADAGLGCCRGGAA